MRNQGSLMAKTQNRISGNTKIGGGAVQSGELKIDENSLLFDDE